MTFETLFCWCRLRSFEENYVFLESTYRWLSLFYYWEYTNILLQCQLFECSCLYRIGSSECDEVEIKKLWLQKFSIFVAIFLHKTTENQDMKILLSDAKKNSFLCAESNFRELALTQHYLSNEFSTSAWKKYEKGNDKLTLKYF